MNLSMQEENSKWIKKRGVKFECMFFDEQSTF